MYEMLLVATLSFAVSTDRPITASAERVVARLAMDKQAGVAKGFDDVRTPTPNKGESFFSTQNLLLGAGLAASGWWDVKSSYDCFHAGPVVKTRMLPNGGTEVTTYHCYEANPRMAEKFARGPGPVYLEKAKVNGAIWIASWGFRWAGGKLGGPLKVIGYGFGYAVPAGAIGFQVRLSINNNSKRRQLERLR